MQSTIALKNIARRKMRSFLSMLGILMGVALIVSLASVSDGLDKTMKDVSEQLGDTIYVVQAGKFGNTFSSKVDASEIEQIEKIPGVRLVSPLSIAMVDMDGYVGPYSFIGNKVYLTGIDPEKEEQTASQFTKIIAGRNVVAGETEGAVLASSLANAINKRVGDLVKIKARGTEYEFTVVGIMETQAKSGDDHFIVDMPVYKKITGEPAGEYNMVGVVPTGSGLSEQIERKIKLLLPGLDPSYARAALKSVESFSSTLRIATWVIAGIAALIGGLGIANSMIMSVAERTRDFGILKAVGWRNSDIVSIVVIESVILSAIGAVGGILVGLLVAKVILPAIITQFTPEVSLMTVVLAFLYAVALGVGGAILPARRAAGLDPVQAFRG